MLNYLKEKIKDITVNRMLIVFNFILFLFFLLVLRLFNMQIIEQENRIQRAEELEKQKEFHYVTDYEVPTRGNIYDKDGNLLAYNDVQYNIDFYNTAALRTNEEKNSAIYELIKLMKAYNLEKEFTFPMIVNERGNLEYTLEDISLYVFLKNCLGLKSYNDLTDEQREMPAQELYDYLKKGNGYTSMFGIDDKYTVEETLEIMAYRYQWYINNPSYQSIRLITDVPDEFRRIIMENQAKIPCIEISSTYKRRYNDAIYFAHIIGYVGAITEAELDEFKLNNETNYTMKSVVGKLGIEKSYDSYLQGELGEIQITVNSSGQVVSKEVIKKPVDGNDVYLTLERESQIAGYYIVEKNVASIMLQALTNSHDNGIDGYSADYIKIPIYDVYSAFINNNLIDIRSFKDENKKLTEAEQSIYDKYLVKNEEVLETLRNTFQYGNVVPYKNYSEENQIFVDYIYDYLRNNILNQSINTESDYFLAYADGEISISEFILTCVQQGNFDTTKLGLDDGYYTAEQIYNSVYKYIFETLEEDLGFEKLVYSSIINDNTISGNELCLILYDENVLPMDDESYRALASKRLSSYEFVRRKINSLEITPAMLALRPCSGSMIVTVPETGDVKALVSYPSFDNNRLTNTIDYEYYTKLSEDMSYPMVCRATQSKTNSGSTFKPLTAIAALTEGTLTTSDLIHDQVKFKRIVPSPSCWDRFGHGTINVSDAIMHSCNYFFFETAYRLASNENGLYSDNQGLSIIRRYATKFGFNSLSGVEISEVHPEISTTDTIRTAIGYYHSFAPVHIARYATTIANSGKCYNLTLVDNVRKDDGTIVYENSATIYNELTEVSQESWDAVHLGMYNVVNSFENTLFPVFTGLEVDVAGKTGTAQVSKKQPNNALFISYAPYEAPEVCCTVVLPNGYTSSNAARTAREYYDFYFFGKDKEALLTGKVFAGYNDRIDVGD